MICLVGIVAILTLCVLISIALQPKDARNLSYNVSCEEFYDLVCNYVKVCENCYHGTDRVKESRVVSGRTHLNTNI